MTGVGNHSALMAGTRSLTRHVGAGVLAMCLACSSATEAPELVNFDGVWQRISPLPSAYGRTGDYESIFDLRQYGDSVYGFFRQVVVQPPDATPIVLAFTPVRGKVTGSTFQYSQFFLTRWLPPLTVGMDGERIHEVGHPETYARRSGPARRSRPDLSRPFAWNVRPDSLQLLPCRALIDPAWSGTHGASTMTFDTVARTVRITELVGPCTAGRAPTTTIEITRPYTIARDMVIIERQYRTSRFADTAVVTNQALELYRREFNGQVTYPPVRYVRR